MLDKNPLNYDLEKFDTLIKIVEALRAPGGCPWDIDQTHGSLKRHLLEECYEVLEAIDNEDPAALKEELGDILVQIAFHADIAREHRSFTISDLLVEVNQKLIRRHPHVFDDVKLGNAEEVELQWEELKARERAEKGITKSPVEGIPKDLPALVYSQLMQDRASKSGFEWEDINGVLSKIEEECKELTEAVTEQESIHEIGDLLLVMVNLCRWMNVQAEDALRQANARFSGRYMRMEELALDSGKLFSDLPLSDKEELWQKAKMLEK